MCIGGCGTENDTNVIFERNSCMKLRNMAVACLTLCGLVAMSTTSVNASSTSINIGDGHGSGTLTSSSIGASASTTNNIGNYYTYAKATVDYSDGDWDSDWGDGLGSASKSVTAKEKATIVTWSSTHAIRTEQAYNEGEEFTGYGELTTY